MDMGEDAHGKRLKRGPWTEIEEPGQEVEDPKAVFGDQKGLQDDRELLGMGTDVEVRIAGRRCRALLRCRPGDIS